MAWGKSIAIFCLVLILAAAWPGSVQAARSLQGGPFPVTVTIDILAPNPAYVEQAVTLTVRVASTGGTPAGQVDVTSSQALYCSVVLDAAGQGTCVRVFETPVSLPLKAVYKGADRFLPGTSPEVTLVVLARHPTTVAIDAHDPFPSILNQPVTVHALVTSAGPPPAGTITVYRSGTDCSSPPPALAADRCAASFAGTGWSCSLPLTQAGPVTLCAAYPGDYAHLPSTGSVAHYVSGSNTAVGIQKVDPSPSLLDQPAWVYVSLTSTAGSPPPTSLIRVTSGETTCVATLAAGRCLLAFHRPHLQPVTATYAGETVNGVEFQPSTSNTWIQRVNAPPVDVRLSAAQVDSLLPIGREVGEFSTSDPNPDETHAYTLVPGAGSAGNAYFSIQGDRLLLARSLAGLDGQLSIRVRSTDPAGLFLEKVFLLAVKTGELPVTGFAPSVVTRLPAQPAGKAYRSAGELSLSIPSQGVTAPVIGVPWSAGGWDAAWLGGSAGWLDGTAFPSWRGNSVLVAHNALPDGSPGPFANLASLKWGDRIEVNAYGAVSVYEVRSVERVSPRDASALRHEENAWLTLITCQSYDETQRSYRWRMVVRAVLVDLRSP